MLAEFLETLTGVSSECTVVILWEQVAMLHNFIDRFLYGPVDEEPTLSQIPRIYVGDSMGKKEQCHLLVFRAYSATLCLLVSGERNSAVMHGTGLLLGGKAQVIAW